MIEMDLNEAIVEVLLLLRGELHRQGVEVTTDLASTAGPVLGDKTQLQQVMLNLIMNGVEAMADRPRESRRLLISSAGAEPGYVQVKVSDTGPGFDPTDTDQIFEAFFTTKPSGVGLGLSICRSIIDSHGGRLSAVPDRREGSVFQFTVRSAAEAKFRDPIR